MARQVDLDVELELLAVRKVLAAIPRVPEGLRISVNVGVRAALHPDLYELLDDAPLERMTLELTEHDEVSDYAQIRKVLDPLRARGLRLSVDDTGSGYSGRTHVLHLHPDEIKLDRELVTGVNDDPAKKAMATSLVSFADAIGAQLVAEGIELEGEVDCLRRLGLRRAQGYLFGRPGPPEELRPA
jgi:EAL domain-containing protein (putative c-di-GMP-specific phosphodiesterase class I)